jgi:peptidyl-prolyl isomerase D
VITDAGELSPSDPSLTEPVVAPDGDPYEDHPEDDSRDTQDPKVALEAGSTLRTLGNARWKESAAADALAKWQKALRYLDVHHEAPEDLADEFLALRTPLLLNSALAALKAPGGPAGARIAINATNSALELPKLSDADRGMYWLQKSARRRTLTMTLVCAPHLQRRHCIVRVLPKSRSRRTKRLRG